MKVEELDAPLAILERSGHIRDDSPSPGSTGGRPSTRYVVNPYVLGGCK